MLNLESTKSSILPVIQKAIQPENRKTIAAISAASLFLIGISSCGSGHSLPEATEKSGPEAPANAIEAAAKVFENRFEKIGDSHYTIRVVCKADMGGKMGDFMKSAKEGNFSMEALESDSGHAPLLIEMELIQLKGLKTAIEGEELTEADKLNDISWKGSFTVTTTAERRRNLDLMSHFKTLARGAENVSLTWVDSPLIWQPSKIAATTLQRLVAQAENGDSPEKENNDLPLMNVFSVMQNQVVEAVLEAHKPTGWRDWWQPEGSSYQYSEVTIRENQAYVSTIEDKKTVLGGGNELGLFMPDTSEPMVGGLITMAAAEGDDITFLVNPNRDFLKTSGLLD